MYSGGPEFWNRRNHTVRNPPHPKAREWAKSFLPATSVPGLIEDSKVLRLQIQDKLSKKDLHGQNGQTEFTGCNHLLRAFNRAHRGPGVMIDIVEFKRGLIEFAVHASDAALQTLFNEFDRNQVGKINYCEFVARIGPQSACDDIRQVKQRIQSFEQRNPGELHAAFEQVGQNGTITPVEMRKILKDFSIKITDWDYEDMLNGVEQLHGMVIFEDFLEKFAYSNHNFTMTISPRGISKGVPRKLQSLSKTSRPVSGRADPTSNSKELDLGMEIRSASPAVSSEAGDSWSPRNFSNPKFKRFSPRRPITGSSTRSRFSAPTPPTRDTVNSRSFFSPRSHVLKAPNTGRSKKSAFLSTWASAPSDEAAYTYKALLRSFLGLDVNRCGKISTQEFRSVLIQHKSEQVLPSEELSNILSSKSDVEDSGVVNYMNFLRYFKAALQKSSAT